MFDPTKYWEESLKISEGIGSATSTSLGENFGTTQSKIWTKLSMLPASEQNKTLSKIITRWPIAIERNAVLGPHFVFCFASGITTSMIAKEINSNFFLFSNKIKFLEVFRTTPKVPFVLSIYISGLTTFALNQMYVYNNVIQENEPCSSCILSRSIFNGIIAGVVIPMISVPMLAHYIMFKRDSKKVPVVKNIVDLLALSTEGVKICRKILPIIIGIQITSGALGACSLLWGRNRIFATMNEDSYFVEKFLDETKDDVTMKDKIWNFFSSLPFVNQVMDEVTRISKRT